MVWFKKSKDKSCCNVKIEEVKEEGSSCCAVKIEEIEEVKKNK
ncbi:hypothetical protein RRV45_01300 [Bacillus sp. DTU_2020_1000418_1_SI_GHA_SEK_038]|nr:hypothetical protein [Bacillus sp. DTU_2020_1000418_1_SI_GHA_SEK_038]WNS75712.1 hypothetical protein RRV45_01300 [Bacillus sp. DTU_2020_1000418_1_SI_GHA_SEK_038]